MKVTYLTTDKRELDVIDRYTDACQTVRLADGRYGFCDGLGGVYATAVVMIPGYDYVYGQADASGLHTNANGSLMAAGAHFPQGSRIHFRNPIK